MLHRVIIIAVMLAVSSCRNADFTGENKKNEKDTPTSPAPEAAATAPETPLQDTALPNDAITNSLKTENGRICFRSDPHLDVIFVLDTTASMQPIVNELKDTLNDFINSLKNLDIEGSGRHFKSVALGLVTYNDAILYAAAPIEDATPIHDKLTNIVAEKGGDPPEGGLLAASKALQLLATRGKAHNGEAYSQVMLVITDTFSHTGTVKRVYRPNDLITSLKSPAFDALTLYTSVPDLAPSDTNYILELPTDSPESQWQLVRDGWLASRTGKSEYFGKHLPFPLKAKSLTETLTSYIKESTLECDSP